MRQGVGTERAEKGSGPQAAPAWGRSLHRPASSPTLALQYNRYYKLLAKASLDYYWYLDPALTF
jgi:hypothetical protein